MQESKKKTKNKSAKLKDVQRELWRRGSLSWKLKGSQKLIEDAFAKVKGKLFVCNCSRRFGKSFWAAKKCLERALGGPNQKIKFASAFANDLEEIIIPAFNFLLEDCPPEILPEWQVSRKKFIFKNGSEIQLIGLDRNPNGPRGQFCDLFIFEEAGFINRLDYLYSAVVIPMFKGRPNAMAIMISTPPISPAHPFQIFCKKSEREGAYAKFTIYEDPEIEQYEIDELKAECLTESDWLREFMVEFVIDSNLGIVPEWKKENVQDYSKDEYWKYYHKYVSMDLGVRDKTAALFAVYDFLEAKLFILDEMVMAGPEMTTDKLAVAIADKEKESFGGAEVYRRVADNNNLLLLQDLTTLHGLTFSPTTKGSLEAMINRLRLWVKQGKIVISPKFKELIGCLETGIWKKNRKEFDRSPLYGHFDALAGLMYLVRNVRENVNPIPALYNLSQDSHFIEEKENYETTQNISMIKKMFRLN